MKCGRVVENAGIFSQDPVSSAGEAQAQPMFFSKNPRSIVWLPKFWWGRQYQQFENANGK
jgi:hypothetical protein